MSDAVEHRSGEGELDWRCLYETYSPLVRRHAAKLVDSAHVDDIVQETFMRAFRNRDSIRPGRPLAPWLTVIARRAAIDVVRRQQARDRLARGMPSPTLSPEPIEDAYFNAVRRTSVRLALGGLNERHRRLLTDTTLDAESEEARGALDGATRSVLARARRGFRDRYLDLSRQTGVFGGAVLSLRRKSARDALVRAEVWLQTGMPMLIAACAGMSVLGSALSSGSAAHATTSFSPGVEREAALREAGEGGVSIPLAPPKRDSAAPSQARDSGDNAPAAGERPNEPMARTFLDWQAGHDGDRAGIGFHMYAETYATETNDAGGLVIYCKGGVVAGTSCRAWDEVPDSGRHHEIGVDDAGGGADLTR